MKTIITYNQQIQEALGRMRSIPLADEIINRFEKERIVHICGDPAGLYSPVTDDVKAVIQAFEDAHDAVVYLVVRWETVFGRLDSLLYVGPQVVEWKYDHDDIADGYALTFTKNWANDDFSEFGYIAFRKHPGAGITRIG